jgi:signal peptidase II
MRSALVCPAALLRFILTAAVGTGLDLWTKSVAFSSLSLHGAPYEFLPGWLDFEAVVNHGAVFGLGQGARVLFIVVSIGAVLFLTVLFATSGKRWVYQILLGMLMAGVFGNLFDRIKFGYVRDMIHALPMWKNFFPYVFNVADSFLCTGVTLMILYSLVTEHQTRKIQARQELRPTDG